MLTTRKLATTVAIFAVGLIAMNLATAYLTRNSIPRRLMRHVRDFEHATVLALGNSLIAAGFDESAFDASEGLSAPGGAVNLGLGAAEPPEHLLLLRYALSHGLRPRAVIYGFYDFQLTTPTVFTNADLIGNNAMAYYVEPSYGRRLYGFLLRDALEFRAMHWLPMFADRGSVWTRIEIILRRRMAQQGMPVERSNQFGRAADFSLLESKSADDFRDKCEASINLPLSAAVSELLRQSKETGATISVVEMPMRQAHRTLFYGTGCWPGYVAHVKDLLGSGRANFIDASAWIEDDALFEDALHLSAAGAEQFSRRLGGMVELQSAMRIEPEKLP